MLCSKFELIPTSISRVTAILRKHQNSEKIPEPHFIEFHQIDGGLIRSMILLMDGAAGPSGMDVSHWKKVCTSFARESDNICDSIAMVARKICSSYVDPLGVSALVASRLIALDKNPGVRPIGIGEVVRRVIGKAILSVIKSDILRCYWLLPALCWGQLSM